MSYCRVVFSAYKQSNDLVILSLLSAARSTHFILVGLGWITVPWREWCSTSPPSGKALWALQSRCSQRDACRSWFLAAPTFPATCTLQHTHLCKPHIHIGRCYWSDWLHPAAAMWISSAAVPRGLAQGQSHDSNYLLKLGDAFFFKLTPSGGDRSLLWKLISFNKFCVRVVTLPPRG